MTISRPLPARPDPIADVRDYYTRLDGRSGLATNACRTDAPLPRALRQAEALLDPEILVRSYGCGSPIPPAIEGRTVVDLGCGAGRDAYIASALVGPAGRVIGIDATDAQLEVARRHVVDQTVAFGLPQPNVDFRSGRMEDLRACGIEDASVDVVIANCAINLASDTRAVFAEALRVLRPGGELLFSDVFVDRRLPASLSDDPLLRAECLAGALYPADLRRLLEALGCLDHRVVTSRAIAIGNADIEARIGAARFHSATVRLFRLDDLEDRCEDYGQVAVYRGTIPESPGWFRLDDHHRFEAGRPALVCANTASMLARTRYGEHFEVRGDRSVHFGPFPCGPGDAAGDDEDAVPGPCC